MQNPQQTETTLQTIKHEMQHLRDELRLKAHLGKKELEKSLDQLEGEVKELEARTDDLRETAAARVAGIRARLTKLRDRMTS